MQTEQASPAISAHPEWAARPVSRRAERATGRLTVRQTWFGALMVAASAGLLLWLGTDAYDKAQGASGSPMAALADNSAVRALYGIPTAIDTVGGFAVWRVQIFVMLLGTVWVVLATSRVLRGNEETGRLDLVLASPLSLTGATAASLAVLLGAPLITALTVASVLWGAGAAPAGAWLYGAGIGLLLCFFIAVTALACQFVPEKRRATGLAAAVLFGTFVLRMFANGSDNAGWVRWTTPFGWVEELHAFGGNDLLPLVPLVAAPAILAGTALVLARRRDVGAGMLAADDTATAHTRLLTGPLAFATRRRVRDSIGWALGMVVLGILSGGLAESFVGFPESQPQYVEMLDKVGMGAAVTVGGWVAIMNIFTAVVLACYGIACVHADYDDEVSTRLDLPYSTRASRTQWAGATLLTTTVALVALVAVLALATWAGSEFAGAGLSVGDSFASAMNVLPTVLVFLGLAMFMHGVRPAWTAGLVGSLAIGTYMIQLIGPALSWPSWVMDLSPYYHLALVPAYPPAWTALAIMIAVALTSAGVGLLAYARRDLQ